MSVLVKNSNEQFFKVFTKGSPEKVKELCLPESIPEDFSRILSKYTTVIYILCNMELERP